MRVLITGATGFIGREIVSKLISENFEIVGLSKTSGDQKHDSELKNLCIDITNQEAVFNLAKEGSFDAVIHCAGLAHQFGKIEKERFEKVNVEGTRNIAELAVRTKVRHFILLSSTAVYGLQNKPLDETAECLPDTPYAESKVKAEKACREVCEKNSIRLTILRLAPVLGEKGVGNIPRLMNAIYNRRFIWVGNGENKKSLIYVGDVAEACLKILSEKKNFTEVFNLASEPVKIKKMVSDIAKKLKKPVPNFSIPVIVPGVFFGLNSKIFKSEKINRLSQTFKKWLSEDVYLADKIKKEYGFEPKTSVERAVERQCEWFLREQKSKTKI